MSGSNSSVPDARAPAEPVSLTVHSVALPGLEGSDVRRTRRGRLQMLLVLLACAAPVVASYLLYYGVRPGARSNYGALIEPTRAMPALPLRTLHGAPVAAPSLHGQWLLVAVGPADCPADCEQRLYLQRQLREMLGRERDRFDKLWLVTGGGDVAAPLQSALAADESMYALRVPEEALAAWLEAAPGRALREHLYVVDPHGEWMLRLPADADPQRAKRDLEKLLRASAGWDRPGR
jgi:hypothetical protein